MRIKLRPYGVLRGITGEVPNPLEVPGRTIGDLIELLALKYGQKVKEELLDEKGNLDFSYAFFVKGDRRTDINSELREGDEIVITNILGGGDRGFHSTEEDTLSLRGA